MSPIPVLIADDEDDIRRSLADFLTELGGFEVVGQASNGIEAVDGAKAMDHGVVLMDLRMPVMDGVEATRRIAGGHPGVVVLVHSAYGDDSLVIEALQAGAHGFVLKGVSAADLTQAIISVAAGRGHVADEVTRPIIDRLVTALGRERETRLAAEAAREQLSKLNEQRTVFAIQAAHELRTPLTGLLGSLELLAEADSHGIAGIALGSARRLVRLIENLEAVATLDQIEFRLRPERLAPLVSTVADELHLTSVVCEFDPTARVIVDHRRFEQALANVLRNATAAAPGMPIRVTACEHEGAVSVDVCDEGPGFDVQEAFEAFEQRMDAPSGLGVGLWVARELVGRMGGRIELLRGEGGGACVRFVLKGPS